MKYAYASLIVLLLFVSMAFLTTLVSVLVMLLTGGDAGHGCFIDSEQVTLIGRCAAEVLGQ
jgi:hypothetical protein